MLVENIDRSSIEKLVRAFYANVLQDEVLAPFFINALGHDMKNDKWYEHLITLDNFWLGLMLKDDSKGTRLSNLNPSTLTPILLNSTPLLTDIILAFS